MVKRKLAKSIIKKLKPGVCASDRGPRDSGCRVHGYRISGLGFRA